MFEIRQENDMLAGTSLVIAIEESELDKKALHTIREAKPGFVLPFRTRHIDGKIEFIYQAATLCKLLYITGDCMAGEYVELWKKILKPLLECDDWFMKVQSFILDTEHLYYDKDKKSVSYIYVPSKRDCSGPEDLLKMSGELAKQITVMDMALENKVLRMIMNGFKPKEFLDMLNEHNPEMEQAVTRQYGNASQVNLSPIEPVSVKTPPISLPLKELQTNTYAREPIPLRQAETASVVFEDGSGKVGDIIINRKSNGREKKKQKEKKKSLNKSKKNKKKDAKSLLSTRIDNNADTLCEADLDEKFRNEGLHEETRLNPICNAQPMLEPEPFEDATQYISAVDSGFTLRLIGSSLLPSSIRVQIEDGEVFTIGRYDATVGRKQSSFEFERKTKAVSRRHAAIKRHLESYSLIDLSSSAGTFANGQKLPPNTPFELQNGTRISFGTSGADYVWES